MVGCHHATREKLHCAKDLLVPSAGMGGASDPQSLIQADRQLKLCQSRALPALLHIRMLAADHLKLLADCGPHRRSQLILARCQGHHPFAAGRPELLDQLVGHMDTFSIMESLVKLVGADEQISNYAAAEQLEWLRDTPLMRMLLDRWGQGEHGQGCTSGVLWELPGSSARQ